MFLGFLPVAPEKGAFFLLQRFQSSSASEILSSQLPQFEAKVTPQRMVTKYTPLQLSLLIHPHSPHSRNR
jgi:hypothetical protein